MRRLPFYTVVLLATLILAWNFSFYRDFYQAQAAGTPSPRAGAARRAASTEVSASPQDVETLADGAARAPEPGTEGQALAVGGPVGQAADATSPGSPPDVGGARGGPPSPNGDEPAVLLHPDGSLRAEGQLEGGLRVGIWTEYYEDGQKLSQGSYRDDLRHGHWIYWYPNGQKNHEGDYEAGRREEIWRSYHENGEPMREGRFLHGEREGQWTQWYSNGQVMESGRFVNGLREGYWEFFDYEGRRDRRTGWYESGRRVRD